MISADYRKAIANLGCCIDGCPNAFKNADACHSGPHPLGKKASDLSCLPFCRFHHGQFDANPRAFAEKYGLDIPAMVEALNNLLLTGIRLHRPARPNKSPQFFQTGCICGWRSGWFRMYEDALGSLHSHLADQDNLARTEGVETDAGSSAA